MSNDTVLVELFLEEARQQVDAINAEWRQQPLSPASLHRLAEQFSYVRGAAVCAELASLARALDAVERLLLTAHAPPDAVELCVTWINQVTALNPADVTRWDAARY